MADLLQCVIDIRKGAPGLQAQLAVQGIRPTPESADYFNIAEGDRAAISRLFVHGYITSDDGCSLIIRMLDQLCSYPIEINGEILDARKGGDPA